MTTADVIGASTIYFTPTGAGNSLTVYDSTGVTPTVLTFVETSLALTALTSGKNYDVFGFSNAGTLNLELSAAWSSDTARTNAVSVLANGATVKTSDKTRRLLGTIRTTGTTTTEDSILKRLVSNLENAVWRPCVVVESTDSWVYNSATIRQANGNAANQFTYVACDASRLLHARALGACSNDNAVTIAGKNCGTGVGVDSTTVMSGYMGDNSDGQHANQMNGEYNGFPGLGFHTIAWLEYSSSGSGNTTIYGDAGDATRFQFGLTGEILG